MVDSQEIIDARGAGDARCLLISEPSQDMGKVLEQAGLKADDSQLREHDQTAAHAILTALLHKDLPFQMPLMSRPEAEQMADAILSAHAKPGSRYYSNGNWLDGEISDSLTESPFAAGIIVAREDGRYFCVWIEDKD
ncbi:hypothetical protein [Solimonas sp. SE-A11]|uniref:hypothetical protein n=1 Tax=Solimonas sp. SE-A11 TaxID=3054954 RepID=UPI00259D20DE|nr:hypothetical protein [Solimonas sp. SE-A11]MDM4771832.1 hypothetical protein [Solimonas sp. SE-A11]